MLHSLIFIVTCVKSNSLTDILKLCDAFVIDSNDTIGVIGGAGAYWFSNSVQALDAKDRGHCIFYNKDLISPLLRIVVDAGPASILGPQFEQLSVCIIKFQVWLRYANIP